jgi:hypothetical protein
MGSVAAGLTLPITAAVLSAQAPVPQAVKPVVARKAAPAGPLPPVPFESILARPVPVVQSVYECAARHPEVLQYVPCHWDCESRGHGGNHDGFVRRRAADGRVLDWDPHGSGCTVCVEIARDAMLMFNSDASPSAIRTAIDQQCGSGFPSQTPTPRPAKQAAKPVRG